ncbi:MAG: hypothetical protein FJ014_13775 [Chloroflexi bacterium]|nr:hypothetical protein [Chloroflexota bacterium]
MKRPDAVSLIAIYHFVMSVPFLIGSFALLFAMLSVLISVKPPDVFWPLFGIGIGLFFCLLFALAFLLVGIGLWRLWPWARWGAIVLAVLSLPAFPVWTAIGGLIIWYLLQDEAKQAFGWDRPA